MFSKVKNKVSCSSKHIFMWNWNGEISPWQPVFICRTETRKNIFPHQYSIKKLSWSMIHEKILSSRRYSMTLSTWFCKIISSQSINRNAKRLETRVGGLYKSSPEKFDSGLKKRTQRLCSQWWMYYLWGPLTHTRCKRGRSEFTGIQFRGGHILHLQQVTEDIIFNLVSSYTPAASYDNNLITMSKN